jgi:hypothetical protein
LQTRLMEAISGQRDPEDPQGRLVAALVGPLTIPSRRAE